MNVYDLIFMACLSLGQGSQCKQDMLKCVLATRDANISSYLTKLKPKDLTPDQYLAGEPAPDWQGWVLDCSLKQESKKEKK